MFAFQAASYGKQAQGERTVPVNGMNGLAGAIKAALAEMHASKEMKVLLSPEAHGSGSASLQFFNASKKVPTFWGSASFATNMGSMDNVRYSIGKSETDVKFRISFRIVGDRGVDEGACTLSFDKKTGHLSVLGANGEEPKYEKTDIDSKGKIQVKSYSMAWEHKVAEFDIEKGSKLYSVLSSAISDAMAQKPGKADFGDNKNYPIYTLGMPDGKSGQPLTMTVHDVNGDGRFSAGDKVSFSKEDESLQYPDFACTGKGLAVQYELSRFAAGLFMTAGGTSEKQMQESRDFIQSKEYAVKAKYPEIVRILQAAGYPKAEQKEGGF